MADRPSYVVDASIAARWFLLNPPYVELSAQVGDDFGTQRISLVAPDNWLLEVAAAIRHGAVQKLFSPDQAESKIREFLGWEIPTISAAEFVVSACRLSFRFGCGFYDCLYLAVAEFTGYPFIHADGRLHRTLAGRFAPELWIEDYLRSG